MPKGKYLRLTPEQRVERDAKKGKTATQKMKKVYRTKTSAPRLTQIEETITTPSHTMGGFQNLISYYHALVMSKTQGVNYKALDQEIFDTVDQLRTLREDIYGKVGPKTVTPPAMTAGAVIQEASPEVPQQAVFTPPA
jgi:hypothetical protein